MDAGVGVDGDIRTRTSGSDPMGLKDVVRAARGGSGLVELEVKVACVEEVQHGEWLGMMLWAWIESERRETNAPIGERGCSGLVGLEEEVRAAYGGLGLVALEGEVHQVVNVHQLHILEPKELAVGGFVECGKVVDVACAARGPRGQPGSQGASRECSRSSRKNFWQKR